jgi:hypothetical protein
VTPTDYTFLFPLMLLMLVVSDVADTDVAATVAYVFHYCVNKTDILYHFGLCSQLGQATPPNRWIV